jgi:ferredoxin
VRGDLPALADSSFDCIMCGLCVARCPAELVPPNVALLGRRLYGRFVAPPAEHLRRRVEAIAAGEFGSEVYAMKSLSREQLKARYEERDIET